MITLLEAVRLTGASADIFYLRKENADRWDVDILTEKDIRNKYDMQRAKVLSIRPRFYEYSYAGIELEIRTGEVKKK